MRNDIQGGPEASSNWIPIANSRPVRNNAASMRNDTGTGTGDIELAMPPSVRQIDLGLDDGRREDLPELPQGARVWYTRSDGRQAATVVTVHYDGTPPYYTISVNGQERQTVRTMLEPMTRVHWETAWSAVNERDHRYTGTHSRMTTEPNGAANLAVAN